MKRVGTIGFGDMGNGLAKNLIRNRFQTIRFELSEARTATFVGMVDAKPGMGQAVKACLQSLIGSIFSATFESSTLAAKTQVSGQVGVLMNKAIVINPVMNGSRT